MEYDLDISPMHNYFLMAGLGKYKFQGDQKSITDKSTSRWSLLSTLVCEWVNVTHKF